MPPTVLAKGYEKATAFIKENSKKWDVICITGGCDFTPEVVHLHANNYIRLIFDDVDCPLDNCILPNRNDVEHALKFSVGKERILVMCHNGISRSISIAYAIRCKYENPLVVAASLLSGIYHPNKLIIKLASEIFNNKSVYDSYAEWHGNKSYISIKNLPIYKDGRCKHCHGKQKIICDKDWVCLFCDSKN